MAALDFPASPTIGQTYNANGKTWKWDGVSWNSFNVLVAAGSNTQIQYNNSGAFGASSSLTWNNSTSTLGTANFSYTGTLTGGTGVIAIGTNQIYKGASGNVGIGTSSPTRKLHTYGSGTSLKIEGSGTNTYMQLACNSQANIDSGYIGYDSNYNMLFLIRDSEKMRLDSSGNVGIGTSVPSSVIQAFRAGATEVAFKATNGTSDWLFGNLSSGKGMVYGPQAQPFGIWTNNLERFTISSTGVVTIGSAISLDPTTANALVVNSSGNVGIGASSPGAKLDVLVNTATTTYAQTWNVYNGATFQFTNTLGGDSTNGVYFGPYQSVPLRFITNNLERLRITSTGDLLVGNTSSTARLSVQKNQDALTYFDIINETNGSSAGVIQRFITYLSSGAGTTSADIVKYKTGPWYFANNDGPIQMRAKTNGVELLSGATVWTTLSDETEKSIIEPIESAVSKVDTLRSVIGRYNTDSPDVRRPFLIAQDVEKVLPEATPRMTDGKLGLDYSGTIPLLVAAIKELSAKVTSLEAKVH